MKIAVVGTGVVGSILAGNLLKAGRDATLVDVSPERLENLKKEGVRISDPRGCIQGDFSVPVKELRATVSALGDNPPDVLFLCMKACVLDDVMPEVKDFVTPEMEVVSFQNGLGTEDLIAEALGGNKNVHRVVINYAGKILEDGSIGVGFFNKPNYIGVLDPKCAENARGIAQLLTDSGLDTEFSEKIKGQVWEKAILNSALCPLCALTNLTIKAAMETPPLREVVEGVIREGMAVAESEGVTFAEGFFDHCMEYLDKAGPHKPSMCADCSANRKTEIDFLNGMITERGKRAGIPVVYNQTLTALIKGLERHLREENKK